MSICDLIQELRQANADLSVTYDPAVDKIIDLLDVAAHFSAKDQDALNKKGRIDDQDPYGPLDELLKCGGGILRAIEQLNVNIARVARAYGCET